MVIKTTALKFCKLQSKFQECLKFTGHALISQCTISPNIGTYMGFGSSSKHLKKTIQQMKAASAQLTVAILIPIVLILCTYCAVRWALRSSLRWARAT